MSVLILMVLMSAAFTTLVFAGDLEPPGAPAPTMHSLEDIYNLIANIGTAPVEKTGQTTSYETGDDGDLEKGIEWPNPRFTDNGNGTVTDNLTGLIWLKNANRAGGTMLWAAALAYCNSLADDASELTDGSVAGDWRLPNVKELQSLIDYGRYNPALPTGHPFTTLQASTYWSATTYGDNTNYTWHVDMYSGNVSISDKTIGLYLWAVRGGN
jgi:hypothetical protein